MKACNILLAVTAGTLVLFTAPAHAHEVPNINHTHAYQQIDYGKYRQGHYVNGPQGSILIWSPRPYTSYQPRPPVKFARPSPITRAPSSPVAIPRTQGNPTIEYGKR